MRVSLRFPIKGLFYYEAAPHWEALTVGRCLQLRAEPNNRFDRYAVQLWLPFSATEEALIGYLPRALAKLIRLQHTEPSLSKLPNRICARAHRSARLYVELQLTCDLPWPIGLKALWHAWRLRQNRFFSNAVSRPLRMDR